MTKHIDLIVGLILALTTAGCSSDDGGGEGGAGNGGSGGQAAADAAGDDSAIAEGPWECIENNTARWPESGFTEKCGLMRCTPQKGCGDAQGCASDDDCVSSTKEAGWETDEPVTCQLHICRAPIISGG